MKKGTLLASLVCLTVVGTASFILLSQNNGTVKASILTPVLAPDSFNDDFSSDLGRWTVIGGAWSVEDGELSGQTSAFGQRLMISELTVRDFIGEYKVKFADLKNYEIGLVFRGVLGDEPKNCYWVGVKRAGLFLHERKMGRSYTLGSYSFTPVLNKVYTIGIQAKGSDFKVFLDDTLRIEAFDSNFTSGTIGIMAWSSASEHAHFDDVKVSYGVLSGVGTAYGLVSAYNVSVRAGVTQIIVTCCWSGQGDITIANLTSPTSTYYESNMSIYEKTTVSVDETSSVFNLKRASLSINAVTTSETWTLYLILPEVMAYQISVETY